MPTIGVINPSKSEKLIENLKKSITYSGIDFIDFDIGKWDIVYDLIIILPDTDGKLYPDEEFVTFIKSQKYHIELLILVDLAGHVRNVESFVINNKQVPVQYYNGQ